jgi:hypothetical protein
MTKEDIMEMAKMAQLPHDFETGNPLWLDKLEFFARLAVGQERDDCARMCDFVYDNIVTNEDIKDMAFKIRARG